MSGARLKRTRNPFYANFACIYHTIHVSGVATSLQFFAFYLKFRFLELYFCVDKMIRQKLTQEKI